MAERPEDLNLPSAVVTRIVKEALPNNVKVSKEANAAIAKAASVFVLYATSCANNVALKSNRKTLQGSDVIQAMKDMEFNKFVKPLDCALDTWKVGQAKKKEESAKRKKDKMTGDKDSKIAKDGDDDDEVEILEDKEKENNSSSAAAASGDTEQERMDMD